MDQISHINCRAHPNKKIKMASLVQNDENPFICAACMLKNNSPVPFISISQVVKSEDSAPIYNWPLGIDKQAIEMLEDSKFAHKKSEIKKKIVEFYKDLTSQILNTIEESQKSTLEQLENSDIWQNNLIEFYNEHFYITELKDIFINKQDSMQEKFQELLAKVESTRIQDLKQLYSKIQEMNYIDKYVHTNQAQKILMDINNILSKMNFFSSAQVQKNGSLNNLMIKDVACINKDRQHNFIVAMNNPYELPSTLNTKNKIEFILSNYRQSHQFIIDVDSNNNIQITNNSRDISGMFFMPQALDKTKCYIIRFSFNLPFCQSDLLRIGLIKEDQLTNWIKFSEQSLIHNEESSEGQTNVIKGTYFKDDQDKLMNKTIEMRVSLSDGIIQYSDYPNYKNVLQNKNKISQSSQYRLSIGFEGVTNKIVSITHFIEVDSFKPF